MKLKDLLELISTKDENKLKMEVKFNTNDRFDMDFLSIYEEDDKLQIDIGDESE